MSEQDHTAALREQVLTALAARQKLYIRAGGSKPFLHEKGEGAPLDMTAHRGIVRYDPTEMVVTVRAGTPLTEVEEALHAHGQMLPSESPAFGGQATIGGSIASGLGGPREPFAGSLRDIVLGCTMINGKGDVLAFGGQVLKNVAGYDISRLLVGSYGILGPVLQVSCKVMPKPAHEVSLALQKNSLQEALACSNDLIRQAAPVSGVCYHDGQLLLRISGHQRSVELLQKIIGGEIRSDSFWSELNNMQLPFFHNHSEPLWRLTVPATLPDLPLHGRWLIDCNGARRWYRGADTAARIRQVCRAVQGTATHLWAKAGQVATFDSPASVRLQWHRKLKAAFDPQGLFNSNVMYAGL